MTLIRTDPPSLRAAPRRPAVLDPSPHRNVGMPAVRLAPALLNRVIAMAVDFGMPRAEAEEARGNPFVAAHLSMLAMMIWDAAEGDPRARQALERIHVAFSNRRSVGEILAAYEQPANPAELQALLGLN